MLSSFILLYILTISNGVAIIILNCESKCYSNNKLINPKPKKKTKLNDISQACHETKNKMFQY